MILSKVEEAIVLFKKLPFSKSWQNAYVSKAKKILNREANAFEDQELVGFLYIPGPNLVRHFSADKAFLLFRTDNKSSKDWDYKLISDVAENNNRRLAIMYLERILTPLKINFTIDDSYTVYIMNDEVQKFSESGIAGAKEFVNSLYIPRIIAQKKGITETFTN